MTFDPSWQFALNQYFCSRLPEENKENNFPTSTLSLPYAHPHLKLSNCYFLHMPFLFDINTEHWCSHVHDIMPHGLDQSCLTHTHPSTLKFLTDVGEDFQILVVTSRLRDIFHCNCKCHIYTSKTKKKKYIYIYTNI